MQHDKQTIAELVEAFTVSVLKYSEYVLKDSNIANRHFDNYREALRRIAAHSDKGLVALAKLLDDDRIVVRVTVACNLIHFRTEKAMSILKDASKLEHRAIAMLAIVTLKRWERGTYFDPATGKATERPA